MGIFLPALIQLLFLHIYIAAKGNGLGDYIDFLSEVRYQFLMIAFAYTVSGLQSVIYALLMEFVINPRFKKHIWVVLISGFFAVLTGLSVMYLLSSGLTDDMQEWLLMSLLTGLIMGFILRRHYHKTSQVIIES